MGELGGGAFRRPAAFGCADDDEREEIRREFDALREDGFVAEWRDELPLGRSGERFPAAIFHPGDAALQPARWVRRLAVPRCGGRGRPPRARPGRRLARRPRRRAGRRRDRRISERPPRRAQGLIIPTRGQMIATEPLPSGCSRAALRPSRLRLLAADPEGGSWLADSATSPSSPSSPPRGNDAADPGRARGVRRAGRRPPAE